MEIKTRILDKKHLLIIVISLFSIIMSYFNVTYAYFSDTKNQPISIKSVASFGESTVYEPNIYIDGYLTHTTEKTNMIKKTSISFTKDNVEENDYLLTIATQIDPRNTEYKDNEYSSISYEIYHKTQEVLDTSSFSCESNKYNNGKSEDYCNTGTFIENSLEGLPFELIKEFRIKDTNTHYFDIYIYLNNDNNMSKKIRTRVFYLDKPVEKLLYKQELLKGNVPDLSTGLIPVIYDDTKGNDTHWFVADTTKAWYDYEKQQWANAVSVDSTTTEKRQKYVNTDGTYNTGVEITTSDMLAMFVWIPRYSYTIGCTSSSSCLGYKIDGASELSKLTPGAIDINFVDINTKETYTGDSPSYTYTSESDRKPTNYYTHPAFDFGGTKLSGIWVGKFETSVDKNSTCYNNILNANSSASTNCVYSKSDVTPRILPNVLSLVYQDIYNEFETAKKFTSNTMYGLSGDAHIMKNSEWSAVAYLSQSIYGKYGNINYSEKNKEIYKNNSGEIPSLLDNWPRYTGRSQGFTPSTSAYSKEGTYKYDDIPTAGGEKVIGSGTGASTTGTIYGIYDMSGGANEYVMGNYKGTTKNSGFSATWFTATSNNKYFDKFTIISPKSAKTTETIGQAFIETNLWYDDEVSSSYENYPWVSRGGFALSSSYNSGIFCTEATPGQSEKTYSFRSTLVKS